MRKKVPPIGGNEAVNWGDKMLVWQNSSSNYSYFMFLERFCTYNGLIPLTHVCDAFAMNLWLILSDYIHFYLRFENKQLLKVVSKWRHRNGTVCHPSRLQATCAMQSASGMYCIFPQNLHVVRIVWSRQFGFLDSILDLTVIWQNRSFPYPGNSSLMFHM
jgi:hypothetical protein